MAEKAGKLGAVYAQSGSPTAMTTKPIGTGNSVLTTFYLQETVIDIRKNPEKGTGLLIEKDNPSQLINALISLLKLKELSEKARGSKKISQVEILNVMNQIPDAIIKSKAYLDANYYNKIKENCYERVNNNFRWNIVSKKLIELYTKLK